MKNKSPQEQRRFVFLMVGLSDAALGIIFVLLPLFSEGASWIFYLVGGVLFTSGAFMAIFNLTPRE